MNKKNMIIISTASVSYIYLISIANLFNSETASLETSLITLSGEALLNRLRKLTSFLNILSISLNGLIKWIYNL